MATKLNPIEVEKKLKGLDYPAKRQDIVNQARKNGADEEMCKVLGKLPEQTYNKPTDVTKSLHDLHS
ncbi:DUF2795 domain-containing protein [Ktedonosporobacter rubrisoli]|uniref:DUF2795 domain-containing protein n=1 Tax=Ktedonosporobacter rubrisoli TaxID=2509675 RepID=A0A4P6JX26_KTERU|nr:DUF2795 domain-containing protein [Ktedonosporobacter rubrisoli]QBD79576.1 DUF2795 domain-containing protein [Ktedonosporobacter rubrisoli]